MIFPTNTQLIFGKTKQSPIDLAFTVKDVARRHPPSALWPDERRHHLLSEEYAAAVEFDPECWWRQKASPMC